MKFIIGLNTSINSPASFIAMTENKEITERAIFQNAEHESQFRKYGFIKVPFLNAEEILFLGSLCNKLNGHFDSEFTTTIWSKDAAYRKDVYIELKKIYLPKMADLLKNCKPAMATILTKYPGEKSAIDIHQDWSFTNETKYSAVNIWVPLVDTNTENGALCFLPYSHLFDVPFRGRHVTPQFVGVKELIWELGEPCNVKAGEALIFDVKMVHYSNPNRGSEVRTAAAMVALPQEAEILHYINFNTGQNTITEMKVDEFFYNSFSHDDAIPKIENANDFEYSRIQFDQKTFKKEYDLLCERAKHL